MINEITFQSLQSCKNNSKILLGMSLSSPKQWIYHMESREKYLVINGTQVICSVCYVKSSSLSSSFIAESWSDSNRILAPFCSAVRNSAPERQNRVKKLYTTVVRSTHSITLIVLEFVYSSLFLQSKYPSQPPAQTPDTWNQSQFSTEASSELNSRLQNLNRTCIKNGT